MTSLDKLLYDASHGNFPTVEGDINLDEQIDGVTLVKDVDGKIKVSDDFVGNGVELPIDISNVTDLQTELDEKALKIDFDSLKASYDSHKHEISDVNGLQAELDSKTGLPISANDISETSSKQFIDGTLKSQITANQGDISGFGQRISDVENIVNGLATTDEKVKLDANDTSGYLADKLDTNTLESISGKVVAKSLDGMTVSVNELNHLLGLTGNVQSQIDSLSNLNDVGGIVETENDLPDVVVHTGKTFLVRIDSTHDGRSTFYISDGVDWMYGDEIDSGIARDFTVDPIDLATESTSILPKVRYEKQNSAETPFTDSSGNIQASNAEEAIKEVFQYSDSIRKQWSSAIGLPLSPTDKLAQQLVKYQSIVDNLASAITAKGVPTYSYNKLNELPNKIASIPNVSVAVGVDKRVLLNVTAPHTEKIVLNEELQLEDVTTTLLEVVGGSDNVLHYELGFDNTDESDFEENVMVSFDGVMKLSGEITVDMAEDNSHVGNSYLYRYRMNENDFNTVSGFKVV